MFFNPQHACHVRKEEEEEEEEEDNNNKCQLIYSSSDPTPVTPLVWIPYFGMKHNSNSIWVVWFIFGQR
jgi:hypothetical protein